MKIRPIDPNGLIKITSIEELEGKASIKFIDETGVEKNANLVMEIEPTNFKNNKTKPASLKDWTAYMNMLAETAVPDNKIKEMEIKFSKDVDAQISDITQQMVADPTKAGELAVELGALSANKETLVQEMKEEESEKIRDEAKARKNFFVGASFLGKDKEGNVSRAIEIPQPAKRARNMKNVSNHSAVINYSFFKDGRPLRVSDLDGLDAKSVSIRSKLSPINSDTIVDKIFEINANAIDGLSGDKAKYLVNKLLNIYGEGELAKESYRLKKDLDPENITQEQVDALGSVYSRIKDDIVENGLSGYDIGVPILYNDGKENLLNRMVTGLTNGLMNKMTGETKLPNDIQLINIAALQKIPSKNIDGINKADQWYSAINTGSGPLSNIEPATTSARKIEGVKIDIEEFTSSTIANNIREIASRDLEIKKEEIETPKKEEVSDIDR